MGCNLFPKENEVMKKKIISTALSIAMAASLAGCAAALNEFMSLGSGYAVRDLGVSDSVDIYAFDSNVVSVGMLETGEIEGLVVQNPYAMGYLGVEAAYNVVNGHPLHSDHIDTTTTYVSVSNMYEPNIQRMIFRFDDPS